MYGLQTLKLGTKRPLRVAAYCRVSTNGTQEESFEAQRSFFLGEITRHPGWELAGIYADIAKSGTQIKGRTDFQRMMREAKAGQIDYIISKSISRFSRSVADTLKSLQALRLMGVGVYFMEQSLDTNENSNVLVLSVLSAIAEMEAQSISRNVKMTLDAKNAKGTPSRKCCYGYRKEGENWVVVRRQAQRVKLGFLMAAYGYGFAEIAHRLNELEEADRTCREWNTMAVKRMLANEAYIGDILTNKTVTIIGSGGRMQVKNEAHEDQFYISGHHDPLIGAETWKKVNRMMEDGELASQKHFNGIEEVKKIAKQDHFLDEVKTLLPNRKGRYMA